MEGRLILKNISSETKKAFYLDMLIISVQRYFPLENDLVAKKKDSRGLTLQ